MQPLDVLTEDLSWRESELGTLKILLMRPGNTKLQTEVLLRAAWALLYAHYEGFVKFCLTLFYDGVRDRISRCRDLPENTKVFALTNYVKHLRSMNALDLVSEMEHFPNRALSNAPLFPEVETNSNLWPEVLEELLEKADIVSKEISKSHHKIRTLVARRNEIAHGKKNMITEIEYYLSFEESVYNLMYELAYVVDERLHRPPYCANTCS